MSGNGGARGRLVRFGWEHRVRDDAAVTGVDLAVLLAMATFANPDGSLTVSEKRMAACVGKSERTIRRAVAMAQDLGYLRLLVRGHHVPGREPVASTYRLCLPDPPSDTTGQPDTSDRLRVVDSEGDYGWSTG